MNDASRGDNVMSHPLKEQLIGMRRQRQRTDAVIFVMCVAAGLTLVVTAALQAPAGWFPL
jgi:hypothetical protein